MKIQYLDKGKYLPFKCPINRVTSQDFCYLGRGVGRCPYFVRYLHESDFPYGNPYSWVICKAKPLDLQLSLFD